MDTHTHSETGLASLLQAPLEHPYALSVHMAEGHGLAGDYLDDMPSEYQGEGGLDAWHRTLHPEVTQVAPEVMAWLHEKFIEWRQSEEGVGPVVALTLLTWLGVADRWSVPLDHAAGL